MAWAVIGILALFSMLSLKPLAVVPKLLVVALALGLTVPNLYGYVKCSKDSGEKIRGLAQNYVRSTKFFGIVR